MPPAHCSTDPAGFVYIVSPGGKPASFKPTIRLKEPLSGGEGGQTPLNIWKEPSGRARGQLTDRLEAQRTGGGASGQPSFHPSYRGLNTGSARETRRREGRPAPGVRAPEEAGSPRRPGPSAAGTRSRTRDSSAAPPSFLPSPAAPQTPSAEPAAASTVPPRARPGPATPAETASRRPSARDVSPCPSSAQRARALRPHRSAGLPGSASCVACVPPCWPLRPVPSDVERAGEGGGGNLARARRLAARYVSRRALG